MDLIEKKLDSKTVFKGKILDLTVDEVELADKTKSRRECIHHKGGAAVLLIIDNKVLLVKQYRYVYGKAIYEIPAGKLEEGEAPLVTAKRELEEETGFIAGNLVHYFDIFPSPGYTNEIIHIYFAEQVKQVEQKLDQGEFLNIEFIDIHTVLDMINSGEIQDAKTVAAIYKYMYEKK